MLLPYGISSFAELRRGGYAFADKTRFIRDLESAEKGRHYVERYTYEEISGRKDPEPRRRPPGTFQGYGAPASAHSSSSSSIRPNTSRSVLSSGSSVMRKWSW